MKHLLNGVAIAAALAIAAPAWAQAPMTPSGAPKAAAAPAAAGAPMASKQRHKRMRHHRMARHHRGMRGMGGGDMMTEQLNREELARLQGASPMPMQTHGPGGAGQPGPRASGHSGGTP